MTLMLLLFAGGCSGRPPGGNDAPAPRAAPDSAPDSAPPATPDSGSASHPAPPADTSTPTPPAAPAAALSPGPWSELDGVVDSWHQPRDAQSFFMPDIMGSGAALFDANGDGWLDLLALNSRPAGAPDQDGSPIQLFLQQPPARADRADLTFRSAAPLQFQDASEESGLDVGSSYAVGPGVGDLDNDGDLDLYVSCYGADHLFLNDGRGRFQEVTESAGIVNPLWGTAVCMVDYDQDGWLDIFVVNYLDYHPGNRCEDGLGRQDFCGPVSFAGGADKLFRNRMGETGRVEFEDVTIATGLVSRQGKGLGTFCSDFTGDGRIDLYVANDMEANFLWVQTAEGTFQEEAVQRGVAWNAMGNAEASMGVASGDFNDDLHPDLLLTHLRGETNTLYHSSTRSSTPGIFLDATARSGLGAASLEYTGFGVLAEDFDHDGDLDCLIGNGRVKRASQRFAGTAPASSQPESEFWLDYAEGNLWFRNVGSGRFQNASAEAPDFTARAEVTRALVSGDLDRDGDLDVVQTNCGGPLRIFRNDLVALESGQANCVQVELQTPHGRPALGARVILTLPDATQRFRELQPSASYLSAHAPALHFGLGATERVERFEVAWPDGRREEFAGGPANRLYRLAAGDGREPSEREATP